MFIRKYSLIALSYFLLIAALGVLLRSFPLVNLNFNYKYLVHTHSHIALLGWVYSALMVLIYRAFLSESEIKKKFKKLFWLTQVTIVGMLVSFPFTGYALFSILFSTLFIVASYFFSALVFKHTSKALKQTQSYKCIRIALWYMIISSLGPLALGLIMNTLGSTSSWYRNAIYFYLHFQYNGWFILALFGVLLFILNQKNIKISKSVFKRFYVLMNIGVILTFAISILWMQLHEMVNIIAALGSLLQIVAFYILAITIFKQINSIKDSFSKLFIQILGILLVCFSVKLLMQFAGTIPEIADNISNNIDFVIGYLHWVFLGVVSVALLGFLNHFNYIKLNLSTILFYFIGFLVTESVIFYRGLTTWQNLYLPEYFLHYILIASTLLFVAIVVIVMKQFKKT